MIWQWTLFVIVLVFGFVVFRGAPYVPSRRRYIKRAFSNLYHLNDSDVLVDVGSGDGIVLRIASEYGARAIGLELNPVLVVIARWLSRRDNKVEVRLVDFWIANIPDDTTVVYGFVVTRDVKKLTIKMQQEASRMGHPLRLILYGNTLPDMTIDEVYEGYKLYTFHPLQITKP